MNERLWILGFWIFGAISLLLVVGLVFVILAAIYHPTGLSEVRLSEPHYFFDEKGSKMLVRAI